MSVRGYKMALVCQKVISQSRNTLRNGALPAKLGVFMLHCHFTAAKHPAKWGFGCEIRSFYASQPFRSCKMRVTVLRNGTCVPKVGFAVAKLPAEWSFGCEIGNFHALELRSRFAAAKHLAKWSCACENGIFHALVVRSRFAAAK